MDITITITDHVTLLGLQRAATSVGKTTEELAQESATSLLASIGNANVTTRISPFDFLNRFSPAERAVIRTAGMNNGVIADYIGMVEAAPAVNLTDSLTVNGVNELEQLGLISAGRAAQILAL